MNDVSKKIVKRRRMLGLTQHQVAELCECSKGTIMYVEEGWTTIPAFAEELGLIFSLTELETEELMPENHRKHSPEYDPLKYVIEPDKKLPSYSYRFGKCQHYGET